MPPRWARAGVPLMGNSAVTVTENGLFSSLPSVFRDEHTMLTAPELLMPAMLNECFGVHLFQVIALPEKGPGIVGRA